METTHQFGLRKLFVWTTAFSFFLASSQWVARTNMLGSVDEIPLAYAFGFPLMYFGLVVAPFLFLAISLAIFSLSLSMRRFSISSALFLGHSLLAILAGFDIGLNFSQDAYELLILMTICSIATFAEHAYRKLPDWHWWVALMSSVATAMFFIFAVAAAAVGAA